MPELPEVEQIVRALAQAISGRRILAAELRLKRTAPGISAANFDRKLRNSLITTVKRRGKYILIELDSHQVLTTHLRMTGKFVSAAAGEPLPPYAHVVFHLDNDRSLIFCDMRQFGRMRILTENKLWQTPELSTLAPEPLTPDFSTDYFIDTLSRSTRSLKQLLLDQTKVLGLGNIYAGEALFLARISPFKSAATLSRKRALTLHQTIRSVLQEAIDLGSTLRINLSDGGGTYFSSPERFWRVYEREGEPCVNCGKRIRRVVHGGRSTYYCPFCQKR
ncbi:MAG TPA: bifunctional DNA-formamidopyrimidine glycosylase/DNA-(apurinic or apyrimidinic site) lyase [Pyrinomonadaceae bacterium]